MRSWLLIVAVIVSLPLTVPAASLLLISLDRNDWGEAESRRPLPRPVAHAICLGLALVAATAGVAWYVVSPGVASYQLGIALGFPATVVAFLWLHQHLPTGAQWIAGGLLAVVGLVGYVVFGGAYWWGGRDRDGAPGRVPAPLARAPRTTHRIRRIRRSPRGTWGPP